MGVSPALVADGPSETSLLALGCHEAGGLVAGRRENVKFSRVFLRRADQNNQFFFSN